MNLRSLSTKLGLSQTTVSRALNGYPEVSEETRTRVKNAAIRYNYRPNPIATRLATGKSMAIGHVIPVSSKHEVVNPIFSDFVAGAGEIYTREGYEMLLKVVHDRDLEDAYREMAKKGTVDGIIMHTPKVSETRIAQLKEIGLPFVVHGRATGKHPAYSWLDINNEEAFQGATEYLLSSGHRRIGLINGPEDMVYALMRRVGYKNALNSFNLPIDRDLTFSDELTEPYGYSSVCRLLQHSDPPTALLISSILPAVGARRAIQERGLVLGSDISIVIHDDDLSYFKNAGDIPMFTCTRSSVRMAGRRCAEMLLEIISNDIDEPIQELWEVGFLVGSSTGPNLSYLTSVRD